MLIDKGATQNGYATTSPIAGKYLNTLSDPDENGIYRPVFTKISSEELTEEDVKFEDIIIYDGGGV